LEGNTSINPFFYGTYLAETKPNEPVTRSKKQAFQADAVGVAHQLTPAHFAKPHTFRLEWQPGSGGSLDWFVKGHRINSTASMEGDGEGQDWVHVYSLKDKSLKDLMGSQIPIEPTALLFNVAVSSTWGFPAVVPDWCPKCYDCDDPRCACRFYPGFCQMLRSGKTAMYIDHVRVFQSNDADAHVGANHTLGCDPPDYPTKEWIHGHSYRYMRNPPFSLTDKHPLRPVKQGGGSCTSDIDCGGDITDVNLTAVYEQSLVAGRRLESSDINSTVKGRGQCVSSVSKGIFSRNGLPKRSCLCNKGFTGPNCMTLASFDEAPSAYMLKKGISPFTRISHLQMPGFMMVTLLAMAVLLTSLLLVRVQENKKIRPYSKTLMNGTGKVQKPMGSINNKSIISENVSLITGSSI
jgi:hypothetical protein